jgi:hypothetical protein
MSSWAISNGTNYIQIVSDLQTFKISKFAEITMTVTEPVLYFFYSTNNPEFIQKTVNENQNKKALNRRLLEIDFNDVTSPACVSAADLQTIIQGWLDNISGGTPGAHAATHENGGSDEINVLGLSGLLADIQKAYATPGSYTSCDITIDAQGRISVIANGSGGGVPTSRTITINGVTFDLSANRTWTVGDALVANPLSQFAATTSAQLAGVISDETGTDKLVFSDAPTLVNPVVGTQSANDNSTKAASTAYADALTRSYVLCGLTQGSGTSSPADNGTYFFGCRSEVLTTRTSSGTPKVFFPQAGTIIAARVTYTQTAGSNETSTVYLRLNNTIDTTISSAVTNDAANTSFIGTGLNISVNGTSDYVEFKWVCPAWSSNPISVAVYWEILVKPT